MLLLCCDGMCKLDAGERVVNFGCMKRKKLKSLAGFQQLWNSRA